MSFKQLLMKGSTGDHKGRAVPEQNAPSAGRVPASERRGTARNLAVLYLGDARETRLMGGAFSYEHPHLALDLSANLHEASARISEPGRYDALVIGWSIPESEAAALITHIRAKAIERFGLKRVAHMRRHFPWLGERGFPGKGPDIC